MLRGLSIPLHVSPYGNVEVLTGPSIVAQNIIFAVTPSSNRNPWSQTIAPNEDIIFDISDNQVVGGLLAHHVRKVFDEMSQRGYAKLLPGQQGLSFRRVGSDAFVYIRYINLEHDKTETIRIPVR